MNKRIFLYRDKGVALRINLSEIIYLDARANYVEFHSLTTIYFIRTTLDAALKLLPEDDFVQVHRSIGVSIGHILCVGKDSMLLAYGKETMEVPLSKQYMPGLAKHVVLLGSGTTKKPNPTRKDEQEGEPST